jgi:hypothetical protein
MATEVKNRASDGAVFVIAEEAFFIGPLKALQKNNRRASRRSFFAPNPERRNLAVATG